MKQEASGEQRPKDARTVRRRLWRVSKNLKQGDGAKSGKLAAFVQKGGVVGRSSVA
jgi:hypothetical protein